MMLKLLRNELDKLKKRLLSMSAMVEESVHQSVRSVKLLDEKLARSFIKSDEKINLMELEVEEECLKLLALHQPVAIDLRFIIAVLKINNDLERISDQAANIAHQAIDLCDQERIGVALDFDEMARKSQAMLKKSLDALVNLNPTLAYEVCKADDEVDDLNRQMHDRVREVIVAHPEWTKQLINLLIVSRNLERIADLATNIAEDTIYMIEGEIVRHRVENYQPPTDRDKSN